MIYLKILLLKIARYFAVMIGNIIKFFRGNKNIDLKSIKKIIFNRKDRIGDAVITKPFIILFSKYIKEELKLNIEIEVECSKYNEFVFKEGDGEKYYKLTPKETTLKAYDFSFLGYIRERFKCIIENRKRTINNDIVYIDLVGDIQQTKEARKTHKSYIIGGNLLFNNYMIDYSIHDNYVAGNKNNLINSYIKLVSQCFNLQNLESYINKNIEYFFTDYNHSNDKKGILIFVGNKKFRNLPINIRNKIINCIGEKYNNEEIVVIDDNQNVIYNELIKFGGYSNNITFKKNTLSLEELKAFTKKFKLLIGIDGGGFNYIRTLTNSFEIFTLANKNVRSIFSGNNKYKETPLGNNRFLNNITIGNKKFGYIYKKSLILPSYDIEIPKKIFKDIPINKIIEKTQTLI